MNFLPNLKVWIPMNFLPNLKVWIPRKHLESKPLDLEMFDWIPRKHLDSKPSDLEMFDWSPNLQIWQFLIGVQTFRFGRKKGELMSTITIFLASSGELAAERRQFESFIYQRCKSLHKDNVFIDVIAWENSLSNALSQTRLQDEYNKAIRGSDIFVALFATKAGLFTVEEFGIAHEQFKQTNQPQIFTYFQKPAAKQTSVIDFFAKLKTLGHFPTRYKNTEDLHLQFWQQLEFYLTEHKIKPEPTVQQRAEKIYNIEKIENAKFE